MINPNWKTNTIRNMLIAPDRKEKENCYVCGEHRTIAQLHHVIPVEQLTKLINMEVVSLHDVSTPVVWLCPNHHAYIHELMRGNCMKVISKTESSEAEKLLDILGLYEECMEKMAERIKMRMNDFE